MKFAIPILSPIEIEQMRKAGKLASDLLTHLGEAVTPGITTLELDELACAFVEKRGAANAPLGYKGFPRSICTSVNQVVCHGIPNKKPLIEGDIVNIDVTPVIDGFHGDTSKTFFVGEPNDEARRLVQVNRECLELGIQAVKPGGFTGDIGAAIQSHAEKAGFGVVREFTGHGVGRVIHGPPPIFHFGEKGEGVKLKVGMAFTIEPMINAGTEKTRVLADGWTAVTLDNRLSAQCEHTVVVTKDGVEVLTRREDEGI